MKRKIPAILILLLLAISLDIAPTLVVSTAYSEDATEFAVQSNKMDNGLNNVFLSDNCDYIGNSNTNKFHVSSCSSVDQMKPEHKVCFSSASNAKAAGYIPCKRCHPA